MTTTQIETDTLATIFSFSQACMRAMALHLSPATAAAIKSDDARLEGLLADLRAEIKSSLASVLAEWRVLVDAQAGDSACRDLLNLQANLIGGRVAKRA